MITHRSMFRTGVLLFAVLLTGCIGGRSPTVQFYNLNATETGPALEAGAGPAVAVGPVIFPRSLRRSQIVIRTGPNTVELDEFHRWAGSLESDFLDTLGANLGALMATDRVAVYPAEARFPLDYRVVLDIDQFDGAPGSQLILRARWAVSAGETGESLVVRQSSIVEPVAGDTVDALVRAHDAAVGKLSREIADQIKALYGTLFGTGPRDPRRYGRRSPQGCARSGAMCFERRRACSAGSPGDHASPAKG